jgi:pimeloyl-ACP methyl ester carboxylesterase
VATIGAVHDAIARKPFALLRPAPLIGETSEAVRAAHDGVAHVVYAGVDTAVTVAGKAARMLAAVTGLDEIEPRPGSAGDLALAALNGFAGDRLADEGSPLASPMSLRHAGRTIAVERQTLAATFPAASPRLAIFLHGLAGNETWWTLHSERHYGKRHISYGSRLESELGYTPLYVRYNSGLHISQNGRRLAQLLERIFAEWPVPVEELVLVGHSMGGLVIRSATHYGAECEWARRTRHLFFLGSPHLGAPLEKAVNVVGWALGLLDVTQPFAAVLNRRSRGIKDLRFGSLRDQDWQGADLDALLANRSGDVPFLTDAAHYFVGATVTRDRRHPFGVAVGDLLVRQASAFGRGRLRRIQFPLAHAKHFGSMTHVALLNHPDVYEQMRRWLAG